VSLTLVGGPPPGSTTRDGAGIDPDLIARLSLALRREGIRYCQWKGHHSRQRWSTGQGDIDLLVDRKHRAVFATVLERLGFKPALAPAHLQIPGVVSYLAPERTVGRFIHVHAHFRLVVGSAWARHYLLPIEDAVLDSSVECNPFPIPSPEYEFIVTVITSTLRHSLQDAIGRDEARWLRTARAHAERIDGDARRPAVHRAVARHIPEIAHDQLLDRCYTALLPGCSTLHRVRTRRILESRLQPHLRTPDRLNLARRIWWRIAPNRTSGGKTPASGGALIAIVGADGAGKSTCSRALQEWLDQELATARAHLGLPRRSATTLFAGGVLKVARWLHGRLPGPLANLFAHVELARAVCTARDRYQTYARMRRLAARGRIVICERYPLLENRALVGPSTVQGCGLTARSKLASWMRRIEVRYYARITRPDLVLALRIDPEVATRRKTTEPEAYVRARAQTMAEVKWTGARVRAMDASRPFADVMADLQAAVWEAL